MAVDCLNCPLRALPVFAPMDEREVAFMRDFKSGERHVSRGDVVVREGEHASHMYTVIEGMGLRSKTLPEGERQVINVLLPGDFVGMQSGVMGEMKHSVEAITDMRLCAFPREKFFGMYQTMPSRAFDATWLAALEEHFLGDHLAVVGRLPGRQRVAWALLRYYDRLEQLALARNGRAPMPLKQRDVADLTGLSLVHTNKTLRALRRRNIVTWRQEVLEIHDNDALVEEAGTPYQDREARPLL